MEIYEDKMFAPVKEKCSLCKKIDMSKCGCWEQCSCGWWRRSEVKACDNPKCSK